MTGETNGSTGDSGSVFPRTDNLSYDRRKKWLNEGEDAIVTDPYESPLWYVGDNGSSEAFLQMLQSPTEVARMLRLAREVREDSAQRWEQERIKRMEAARAGVVQEAA